MNKDNSWIDSNATDHMTPYSQYFKTYKPCPCNQILIIANGTSATIAEASDIIISCPCTKKCPIRPKTI